MHLSERKITFLKCAFCLTDFMCLGMQIELGRCWINMISKGSYQTDAHQTGGFQCYPGWLYHAERGKEMRRWTLSLSFSVIRLAWPDAVTEMLKKLRKLFLSETC